MRRAILRLVAFQHYKIGLHMGLPQIRQIPSSLRAPQSLIALSSPPSISTHHSQIPTNARHPASSHTTSRMAFGYPTHELVPAHMRHIGLLPAIGTVGDASQ